MSCGCGCGGAPTRPVGNRPSLSEIIYRFATWGDLRASMMELLSTSTTASGDPTALSGLGPTDHGLSTRASDDATIALIDAWAVTGDVLTFYTERLAQESYLRTATEPVSLQELGRLLGYQPRPGVAAETHLAFTLDRPPDTSTLSPDPGLTPPVTPTQITLDVGLRVQSIPGPGEQPVTFETVEAAVGRPEWSSLRVAATTPWQPQFGRTTVWLHGTGLNLSQGAAILIASEPPATTDLLHERWDLRLALDVTENRALGLTEVTLESGLGEDDPNKKKNPPTATPHAFVMRKRIHAFGHAAPVWPAMNDDYRQGYAVGLGLSMTDPVVGAADWPYYSSLTSIGNKQYSLDVEGSHPDLVINSWVVVSQEGPTFLRELYQVVGRAELSRSDFGVSGPVTRLTLQGQSRTFGTPRDVTVFAVSEELPISEAPDPSPVTGQNLLVDGDATAMAQGRLLTVSGTSGGAKIAELVTVDSVAAGGTTPDGGPRTSIRLTTPLTYSYDRSTALVFGNIVKATHGETVHESLGNGDARRAFQRFTLAQGPLTYVQADNASGSSSSLRVSVNGVLWPEVPTHYTAGPDDRTFVHTNSPDPNPISGTPADIVRFGDGIRGSRVPTGSHNVRATYRKGIGTGGNVVAGKLSQALDRPLGLRAATNPLAATGGADPETPAEAKRTIPISTRTLGRAVSLLDYADFSLNFAGVTRADAQVVLLRGGRTVVVSICGPDVSAAPQSTLDHLTTALTTLGDPLVRLTVTPAVMATFRLAMRVTVDPDYDVKDTLSAVRAAIAAAFSAAARELGQPVHDSEVIAVAADVPGIVAVDLESLYRTDVGVELAPHLWATLAHADSAGEAIGTELLALDNDPFDHLELMS